jgi:hypothetical protein
MLRAEDSKVDMIIGGLDGGWCSLVVGGVVGGGLDECVG